MELFVTSKIIDKSLALSIAGLCSFGFTNLTAQEKGPKSDSEIQAVGKNAHRSKRLGDQAFYDGDFVEAIKFYTQYKKDTARVADELELAYEALITSYINVYDHENASLELNKYIAEVGVGVEVLDYFYAEINRIKKAYDKAIPLYLKVLKVARPSNRIYFSTLNGLGLSYEETNDWNQAIIAYRAIEQECPKSSWRQRATKQKIFAMIMAEKFDDVEKLLNNPPKMRKESDKVDLDLFRIFMLAKKKKFLELDLLYKKIQGEIQVESYSLCYKIDMLIAQSLEENGEHKAAVNYLRDAYTFATNAFERQKALKSLINTYVAIDDKPSAVKTAERFLSYYSDSEEVGNIRLQVARLLFRMGKPNDALKKYDRLFKDKKSDTTLKVTAAKEIAFICMDQKLFDKAKEKLNFVFNNVKTPAEKGEAKYYLAKILYLMKNDIAAYNDFIVVADTYKEWREKALHQAMYALDRSENYEKNLIVTGLLIKEFKDSEAGIEAQYFRAIALSKTNSEADALKVLLQFINKYPKHALMPRVLFTVAGLSFKAENHSDCTRFYSELIRVYKDDAIVPNALYKRMFSLVFLGKFDDALKDIERLATNYKDSEYTLHALNWLADHYTNAGEYSKADLTLKRIESFYSNNKKILSATLLDRASVLLRSGDDKQSATIADEIIKNYADQSIYYEALYLRGGIFSNAGEYKKALEMYQKVFASSKDEYLKVAAKGRIGDCNFSLYSKDFNNEFLEKASEMYSFVLAQKNITRDFRIQTLYKIAKCYELLGFEKKAINFYKELLLDYKSEPSESTLWFVKGANALASIYVKKGTPEAGKQAIIIYRDLIKRGIKPVNDYKSEILKIKKKYKL